MFNLPAPDLQIEFSLALAELREQCLQQALNNTVKSLDITEVDTELSKFAPKTSLSTLASKGLRGELVFPCPVLLRTNPYLLGYYRMLYGYSQKTFYGAETGLGRFKNMEMKGKVSKKQDAHIEALCEYLSWPGEQLLDGIGSVRLSQPHLDDLTLLSLGPTLRGSYNVKTGAAGIVKVFDAIYEIVSHASHHSSPSRIELVNAAGRNVLIEFAPDPDIIIREEIASGSYSRRIAIEVKAGADASNIHNRVGEAEKSHQKAKQDGYIECWTVVNVSKMDLQTAKTESPSTNKFFILSDLVQKSGDYQDFCNQVIALTGVKSPHSTTS